MATAVCSIGIPLGFLGAPGKNRTCDLRFRKPLLCPLSYEGVLGWAEHGMGERLVQGRPPRRRTGAVVRAHFEAFLPCLAIILPGSSSKCRAKTSRNAPSVQGPLSRLTHPSAPRRHRCATDRPRRNVIPKDPSVCTAPSPQSTNKRIGERRYTPDLLTHQTLHDTSPLQ